MINIAVFDAKKSEEVVGIYNYFGKPKSNLVFSKNHINCNGFKSTIYNTFNDFFRVHSDNLILLHKSRKLLVAGYPNSPRFVYISIFPILGFIIPIFGLVRRILNESIKYHGIVFINFKPYIKIENVTELVNRPTNFLFDSRVGVSGIIQFLNANSIRYVIPRFFEKLPELHRDGGDLDILVDDKDYEHLCKFLMDNPGDIPIDVHTVHHPTPSTGLPYFPPVLACNMIENSNKHPSGASVPNDYYYLLSIIYHALYHKGFDSGIPSNLSNIMKPSDNDYLGKITELLKRNSINMNLITMENCAKLLTDLGYGLHNDTLEHLRRRNMWVNLSLSNFEPYYESGLGVIFIRGTVDPDSISKIQSFITDLNFQILYSNELSEYEAGRATNSLRGGNWYSAYGSDLTPSYMFVIKDLKCKSIIIKNSGTRLSRVRKLKLALRRDFKYLGNDRFHATDDTRQSIEYLGLIKQDLIDKFKLSINLSKNENSAGNITKQYANYMQIVKLYSKKLINTYVFK